MKKTPMQELIELLNESPIVNANILYEITSKNFLGKEKNHIIKAWKEGWKQGPNFSANPELYFTSSYLSNEEKSL